MKPGDKVWVFNFSTQKIEQVEVDAMAVDGNSGTYMRGGDFGYRVSFRPYYDAFPTREALCEHYRKIFAPNNYLPIKARVINEERLLYGEVVDIWASRVIYIDSDNEHYEKEELKFL